VYQYSAKTNKDRKIARLALISLATRVVSGFPLTIVRLFSFIYSTKLPKKRNGPTCGLELLVYE
jgi:hypothetical protein